MGATIVAFGGEYPTIGRAVMLAPTATVVGRVRIEDEASVWFGAVVRAEFDQTVLGPRSVVEDNCVIHANTHLSEDVLVGHGAVVEDCIVGPRSVIGSGAVIVGDAEIGSDTMIAAGSVVLPGMRIPDGVLVAGNPASVKKELSGASAEWVAVAARSYRQLARGYMPDGLDPSIASELQALAGQLRRGRSFGNAKS